MSHFRRDDETCLEAAGRWLIWIGVTMIVLAVLMGAWHLERKMNWDWSYNKKVIEKIDKVEKRVKKLEDMRK